MLAIARTGYSGAPLQWTPLAFIIIARVFFAQVIADYAPRTIVASYAGAKLWIIKSVVVMRDKKSRIYLGYIATVAR